MPFEYQRVVTRVPSDPQFQMTYPCPDGSLLGGVPIIDCHGDEVCPTHHYACWGSEHVFEGPSTSWVGDQLVSEHVYVNGHVQGTVAAWWSDGSPRALGEYLDGEPTGLQLHWDPNGTQEQRERKSDWWFYRRISTNGWLLLERVYGQDKTSLTEGGWWERSWSENGDRKMVRIDARAPGRPVEAWWDDDGVVQKVGRMQHGRPVGPWLVRQGDGYALERWPAGRYAGVSMSPTARTSMVEESCECPRGAFVVKTGVSSDSFLWACQTLSGFGFGPSRSTRGDGSMERESIIDARGTVTMTAWCRDGSVQERFDPVHPENDIEYHPCAEDP